MSKVQPRHPHHRASVTQEAKDILKNTGLTLDKHYTKKQLAELDERGDGKIDENEALAALQIADADGDGFVDRAEHKAFDYLLGKSRSAEGAAAFAKRYTRDELKQKKGLAQGQYNRAHDRFTQADVAHDDNVHRYQSELGAKSGDDAAQERVRSKHDDTLRGSYEAKKAAEESLDSELVTNLTVAHLAGRARQVRQTAQPIADALAMKNRGGAIHKIRALDKPSRKVIKAAQRLAKAKHIARAVKGGKLDGSDVNMKKLRADIEKYGGVVQSYQHQRELAAQDVVTKLESPSFQKAVKSLPEADRSKLVGDMLWQIKDTKQGSHFFDAHLLPVLEGMPKADPTYKSWLEGKKQPSALGLGVIKGYAHNIARRAHMGKEMRAMDKAMSTALGIKPTDMPKVYDALEIGQKYGFDEGSKALSKIGAGKLAGSFNLVSTSVGAVGGFLALREMAVNPSLRNGIDLAKNALEVGEAVAKYGKVGGATGRYLKFAGGKVAPGLDVLVGAWDANNASKRGDWAGFAGGSMQMAGGAMMFAAAASTGVGLPLAIGGAVLSLGGQLVGYFWGDSATEKWVKENAPAYRK